MVRGGDCDDNGLAENARTQRTTAQIEPARIRGGMGRDPIGVMN
jgi:hypothetical protein